MRPAKRSRFLPILLVVLLLCGVALWRVHYTTPREAVRSIAPGLTLATIESNRAQSAVRMYVVRAGFKSGWRLRVIPAGANVMQRETVSTIAARHNLKGNAPVAINGGFFAYEGAAVGPLKINDEWIRLPWKNRTTIGIGADGKAKIDNLSARAYCRFNNNEDIITVANLNGHPTGNALTVLTPRFSANYRLRSGESALPVADGRAQKLVTTGTTAIPTKGWLLVANGTARQQITSIPVGHKAEFVVTTTPQTWKHYPTILGAGPRLVRAGVAQSTEVEEEFKPDVIRRGPRTAIGIDQHGDFIIVVVDGWQVPYEGLTLPELAQEMKKLGVIDAINLDGGNSTALVVNNRLTSSPVDGAEVTVANAVLMTQR